jgi:hypothetical protein
MTTTIHLFEFLAGQIADTEAGWSLGTFGAIAEFTRDRGEPAALHQTDEAIAVATARGGLRIEMSPELRLIASESPTIESWSHRLALCLPHHACTRSGRTVLTEIGIDSGALRAEDRNGVLFDLGLGTLQVDVCVRSCDPEVVAGLRRCTGKSVLAPGCEAMRIILAASPHRVFISRVGRAEVFQPIPAPGGKSPTGPHTHLLPKLLAQHRTHAAIERVPNGWVPCAHIYPPHPLRDGLGEARPFRCDHHVAFQALLERYGDPEHFALKRQVVDSIMAGHGPSGVSLPADRFARAIVRVALRQLHASDRSSPATLAAWLSAYDRTDPADAEDPIEAPH